ncbi:MAG: hypothetical protein NTY53_26855 [Kiritimatiellaeota bacterium]|nr:hypothetical protein [Kiritimatiellota bacterium]
MRAGRCRQQERKLFAEHSACTRCAPDGTLTPGQEKILTEIGHWLAANGEAIYGTRPWKVFGEGPTEGLGPKFQGNPPKALYTSQDIRFTTKGDALYAIVLTPPADRELLIKSLGGRAVSKVALLGTAAPVEWAHTVEGLAVKFPGKSQDENPVALRIQ